LITDSHHRTDTNMYIFYILQYVTHISVKFIAPWRCSKST